MWRQSRQGACRRYCGPWGAWCWESCLALAPAVGVTAKGTQDQVPFSPSFTLLRQGETVQLILCSRR